MRPSLEEVADLCSVPISSIEDVYACTPLQASMMIPTRGEFFHFILSSAREIDTDGFCAALQKVVAANSILRTRIVTTTTPSGSKSKPDSDSRSKVDGLGDGHGDTDQFFQVVTNEPHVTELQTGFDDLEAFLDSDGDPDAPHRGHLAFAPNALLFRSAVVGKSFIMTVHHAIADFWSLEQLLKVDLPIVYAGQPPPQRTPFRSFVSQCLSSSWSGPDNTAARNFWSSRFKGTPAIFPAPPLALSACSSDGARPTRMINLSDDDGDARAASSISPAHLALYVEAAWVLTASIYADSDTVAYGYVLSGRSPSSGKTGSAGVYDTLGPTITKIPVQAHVRSNATVERLVRDRAAALRELQQQDPAVLQYGLDKIAAVSEAAGKCAGFQTLINIRPSVFSALDDTDTSADGDDAEQLRFRMVWRRGSFPLQLELLFSITENGGVMIEPRTNRAVVSDALLERILNQYEHCLRVLTRAAPQTKVASLALLDPRARSAIFRQNQARNLIIGAADQCVPEVFGDQALARYFRSSANSDNIVHLPPGCGIWIITPEDPDQLAPWGAVGEVVVEGMWEMSDQDVDQGYPEPLRSSTHSAAHAWISPRRWAQSPENSNIKFLRTGVLAKYDANGSISLVGRRSNRVKVAGGQVVQLEQLERMVAAGCSHLVRDFAAATRILRGQTVLVGILCLADERLPMGQELKQLPATGGVANGGGGDLSVIIDAAIESVRSWAQFRLSSHSVPAVWLAVEKLPSMPLSNDIDRVALRDWLSLTLRSR